MGRTQDWRALQDSLESSCKYECQAMLRLDSSRGNTRAAIPSTAFSLRLDLVLRQTKLHLTLLPANTFHQEVAGLYHYTSEWQLFKQWSKAFDLLSDTIYSLVLETGICHRQVASQALS